MKIVVIQQPGRMSIENDVQVPTPGEGEALLQVLYCGICGADVASYTGNQPFTTYPRIPGHEFSARIVSIPDNSKGLKVGDIVTCNPYFNCGECYSCRRGFVNCCTNNQTMGVQRDGAFQEYLTMPIDRIYSGKGLSAKQLAMVEPFCIGHHGVSRCNIKQGDKVLVIGAGPIGIFAMLAAKSKGADVYMADVLDGRLSIAKEMGAAGTVNSAKENLSDWSGLVTDGNGFDVCIEACGLPQTFLDCIEQAAFAGNIVLIGNGKRETTFLHSIILKKELNIFGSRNAYESDFEQVIEIIKNGSLEIEKLISREYPIELAGEAFESLVHTDGSIMKVLLKVTKE